MKTHQSSHTVDGSHCIELIDVTVLSFVKELVFRAIWQCWEQQYETKNCVVYELEHFSWQDAVAGKIHLEICNLDDARAPLQILFVLKALVEHDRISCVGRSRSNANAHFAGAYVDETWWEELRTIPAQDGDVGSVKGTLTLSCS